MKSKIAIVLLFCSLMAFGQSKVTAPVTINVGNSLYWTVNGQDYPRSAFGFNYTYNAHDSDVSIFYRANGAIFLTKTVDTMFKWGDTSSNKVRNMGALRTWLRTNAY